MSTRRKSALAVVLVVAAYPQLVLRWFQRERRLTQHRRDLNHWLRGGFTVDEIVTLMRRRDDW